MLEGLFWSASIIEIDHVRLWGKYQRSQVKDGFPKAFPYLKYKTLVQRPTTWPVAVYIEEEQQSCKFTLSSHQCTAVLNDGQVHTTAL